MRGSKSENAELRRIVLAEWKHSTDYMLSGMFEGVSIARIRGIRRSLGLRRSKEHLEAMHEAGRMGKVDISRGPDKAARQLSAMQIANRRVKGLL